MVRAIAAARSFRWGWLRAAKQDLLVALPHTVSGHKENDHVVAGVNPNWI